MKRVLPASVLIGILVLVMPVHAQEGDVILNPGTLSGSVSVVGYDLTRIAVRAIDTNKEYSATVTVSVPAGASSIDYTLTVEGDKDYYVTVDATVLVTGTTTTALFPVSSPVGVPVGGDVPFDLSMDPAFISGNISTGSSSNTITNYSIYAQITLPEFEEPPSNRCLTYASGLNGSGNSGINYTLLVASGTEYYRVYAYITIDCLQYRVYDYNVMTPAAGATLMRDYHIDVTSATISGYASLAGIDVTYANVFGYANSPYRTASGAIPDVSTGVYTINVDAGAWRLRPYFSFKLPDDDPDLSGLAGWSYFYSSPINVNAGDALAVDFDVVPGFIPGTLDLWGANTDFLSGQVGIYSTDYPSQGYSNSQVDPDTGKFLFVCSPGNYRTNYYQDLYFDYPDDTDTSLYSTIRQYNSSTDFQSVAAGETTPPIALTFGTITVRRYFYVAGDGVLSRPYIRATRSGDIPRAYGYGSHAPTTEGQAIVTLLLPGTYSIEAFATVDGSVTEFGAVEIDVEEGDVVVIGGSASPIVKVTNPTNGEIICGTKATIEGTVTDDIGIASITINGENVDFDPADTPGDPISFSHEVTLSLGENLITIVVSDIDQTAPARLTMTVISEDCGNPCPVVAIDSPTDGATVNGDSVTVEGTVTDDVGIDSITINGVDVPFEPAENPGDPISFSHEVVGLSCGENIITISVKDLDKTEPVVSTLTVVSTACSLECTIDIHPNRYPNPIDLDRNYTIYVAVLGSEEFLVTDLDSSSIRFGSKGTEAKPVRLPVIRDLNADGFDDALYGFLTTDCGFSADDNVGLLTGQTTDSTPITGSDSIAILP